MPDASSTGPARDSAGVGWLLSTSLRRWRVMAGVGILSGLLALGVGFLMPKWYEARASLLPPREPLSPLVAVRGLGAALQMDWALPFSAGVTLYDVYLAILDSDTVARTLVERFDLQKRWDEPRMVRAVRKLRSRTVLMPGDHRIIEIRVEDKDPRLAADLANAYVEELDRVFREFRADSGRRQREFLEARLARSRADLDSAETALARISSDSGLPALSRDLTEAALAAGELLGRRLFLSIRLEILNEAGVTDSPERLRTESELRAVTEEAARLPGPGLEAARALRDVRVHEFLGEALAAELEAARVEETRNTPVVDVLDRAIPPDRHTRPRKGLMAVAGAFAGCCLALLWTVYAEPRA